MTYLQLMIKCLTFFKNQKEKFDSYEFYYHWIGEDGEDVDSYYKSEVKKALMYLILLETENSSNVNNPLLNILEKKLSYYDISLCKTIEKIEEKMSETINEDPYMLDQIYLLGQDELTDEEINEIINDLSVEFKKQMPSNWEIQLYESAIHSVMEMVSQIIPELFFTEKGYKYIDKDYQIDNPEFRRRCYEYLKDNINYYNYNRLYRVDENIYSQLYLAEEALDTFEDSVEFDDEENLEQDIFLDDDEIRGQVNIYYKDVDNYDILYYSVTLLMVILRFIKNKQYDKIEKMMEIDDIITHSYENPTFESESDKTIIESLYQPKTMEQDYHREISTPTKSDFYLEFFLASNEFTQQYSMQQLSLIISHCFNLLDSEPLNKIIKNSDVINNIFATTGLDNQKERIKRLVRIRKEDNK